jgi:hypothetical protein
MAESTQNQDLTNARNRAAPEPLCDSATALDASHAENGISGAPPSNTAPANYIDGSTRIFRAGIDSLYLSWSGTLSQEYDELLTDLKAKAQSPEPKEQCQATLQLFDHRFEVSDKGKGRFPFVLRDNWYHIQLSRTHSSSMPMAVAQISSEVLSKSGYLESVKRLEYLISQLGEVGQQKISRIDVCVDFYTEHDLESIPRKSWVTHALGFAAHYIGPQFSGYSFGMGGQLSARLYDKYLEIKKSNKTFFYELWKEGGWLGELPVWRLEFQFRRPVILETGVNSTDDLEKSLNGLWQYACQNWLRLTLPSNTDTAKTRWLDHPLWVELKEARFNGGDVSPLYRTRKERLPSDEFLYVNGMGAFTSLMASEGISNLDEALRLYVQRAQKYHRARRASGNSLGTYVAAKAMQKARKFNTRLKSDPKERDPKAYQKAKGGE